MSYEEPFEGYRVLDEQGRIIRRLMRIEPEVLVDTARGV